ncbi:MAG: hypothetical protein QOF55_282, partial [Thermoleophilaceae bacterium]|nr:hypothetical protein [Thermoleophilaceae bacterium]
MTGVARRLALGWLAMLVLAAFGVVGAERARAAQYTVSACGAAAGFQNNLLTASVSDGRMSAYTACPNDGSGHFVGVAAIAGVSQGSVPVFANSIQSFLAPAGTTIRHLHVKAEGRAWNGDWASLLQASNDRFGSSFWNLSGCSGNAGSANGCVSALVNLVQNYDLNGATGVRALVSCGSFSGCTTVSTGSWPFTRAYYFLHEFDVALEDDSSPVVGSPGGALASQQWLHGSHTLTFDARDNSGIRRTRFWVDDLGTINDDVRDCNYTYAVPCSNVPNGEYSLDTSRLTDGIHHIAADGLDATDTNVGSVAQTIFVDNHAPAEPGAPFVVEGEGWHTTNDFTVRWTNPPSAAPIERASYEICAGGGGGPCTTGTQASRGVDHLSNLQVAGPGDYTVRVWLADGAGNVSDAKSAPLHLKFDNVPPAQAQPQHRNGWVNEADAKRVDQEIDPNGNPPVSGIAGYAVTTDGSSPGEIVTVPANGDNGYVGHADLVDLPEGTTTVRARAISGAGISSHEV